MSSSVPRNIEIFDRVVALTLVKLHESFPSPIDLEARQIGAEAAHDAVDGEEIFTIIARSAEDSIAFLVREGFIHYDVSYKSLSGPEFPQATLTMKGFSLLGSTPNAVDESVDRRPFIDQLKGAVREGGKASVPEIIKSLLASAVQLGGAAVGIG